MFATNDKVTGTKGSTAIRKPPPISIDGLDIIVSISFEKIEIDKMQTSVDASI
jgi:hypothetical protein